MIRKWTCVMLLWSMISLAGCNTRRGVTVQPAAFWLDRSRTVSAVEHLLPRYTEELSHAIKKGNEDVDRLQSEVAELARRKADWNMAFGHYQAIAERNAHPYYAEQARHYLTLIPEKQQAFVRQLGIYDDPSQAEATRAEALVRIGEIYDSLGAVEKAIEYWKRFVTEFPDHTLAAETQFRIGSAYFYSLYDYERGWPEFTKLIEDESLAENPRRREAEKLLKRVKTALDGIKQDMDSLRKYRGRSGLTFTQHGRKAARRSDYGIFAERAAHIYLRIARTWEEEPLMNYPNAIATYRELALELPDERANAAKAWFRAGHLYQKLGRYEMAITCYDSLLEDYRDAGWLDIALYQEAQCYETLYQLDMAHARYREYLELGSDTDFFEEVTQHVQEIWGDSNNR